jgi:hypothetical protein
LPRPRPITLYPASKAGLVPLSGTGGDVEVPVVNMLVRRTLCTVTAALSAAAMLCGPADAATRYAAPGATDVAGDCLTAPCRIDRAVSVAATNDTVELAVGTYNIDYPVSAAHLIDVRGLSGGSGVRLIGTGAYPTLSMQWGGTLSNVYLYANATGQHALDVKDVNADRVVAESEGSAHAVNLVAGASGTVLRNSVARVRSGGGHAIQISGTGSRSATLLNVTALSPATAVLTSGSAAITIKNSIARGAVDIDGAADVSYSSFRPARATAVTAGAGNQPGDPLFVDEAGGDLRPATGSPTIDAGVADVSVGAYDVLGQARTSGTAIDIGAHERQPAPPPPPDSTPPPADPGPGPGSATGGSTPTATDTTVEPKPGTETSGTSGTSGTSATSDGSATPAPLPPASDPVLGTSVTLGGVKGAPLVRLPGSGDFVPLTATSTVPVGAVVDATHGTIELTSALDAAGAKTQTGTFWGGAFRVGQSRSDGAVELTLQGGDFGKCRATRGRSGKLVAAGGRHAATIRRLWGRDHKGRFRSRGRHGSATVRGTRWLTEDRCDGTLFKVAEGAIDVRDGHTRKIVRVKRGGSYLAAAKAAEKPRGR